MVARNFFLLLLNYSAWFCLGPAYQDIQTFIYASVYYVFVKREHWIKSFVKKTRRLNFEFEQKKAKT